MALRDRVVIDDLAHLITLNEVSAFLWFYERVSHHNWLLALERICSFDTGFIWVADRGSQGRRPLMIWFEEQNGLFTALLLPSYFFVYIIFYSLISFWLIRLDVFYYKSAFFDLNINIISYHIFLFANFFVLCIFCIFLFSDLYYLIGWITLDLNNPIPY